MMIRSDFPRGTDIEDLRSPDGLGCWQRSALCRRPAGISFRLSHTAHRAWASLRSAQLVNYLLIDSVVFSPDGKVLACGSIQQVEDRRRGEINLWAVASGERLTAGLNWLDHQSAPSFSPDSKTLICSGPGSHVERLRYAPLDGPQRSWDPRNRQEPRHPGQLYRGFLAWLVTPDMKRLVTVDGDEVIQIKDDREKVQTLNTRAKVVVLSADGRTLATAGKAVELWDVKTGNKPLHRLGEVKQKAAAGRVLFSRWQDAGGPGWTWLDLLVGCDIGQGPAGTRLFCGTES